MNDDEIEQRLLDNGFTVKESRFIKYWVKKERSTYKKTLKDLRRIFIGGVFIRAIITVMLVISYIVENLDGFYAFLIPYFFSMIACEFFAPFIIGAKIFIHHDKFFS